MKHLGTDRTRNNPFSVGEEPHRRPELGEDSTLGGRPTKKQTPPLKHREMKMVKTEDYVTVV